MMNRLTYAAAGALIAGLLLVGAAPAGASAHKAHHQVTKSCKAAINYWQAFDALAVKGFDIAANYPSEFGPIATAVENNDAAQVSTIVTQIQGYNSSIAALTKQISNLRPFVQFEDAQCLAGN